MSDIAVHYALTTPGTDITFNDGVIPSFDDLYFITGIRGIDGAPLRTPQDDKPQAHGGLVHNFWKAARHVVIEGEYLVQSTRVDTTVQTIRNQMDADLFAALEAIIQANGTLAWTPLGQGGRSLTVRYEVPLETDGVEQKTFTFGLIAADPDW